MNRLKNSYPWLTSQNTFETFFIVFMFLAFAIFFVSFVNEPHGRQANVFILKTENVMGDFTNPAKYSLDRNIYQNTTLHGLQEKAGLPLAYLFLYPLAKLSDFRIMDAYTAVDSTLGLTIIVCFFCLIAAVFFIQLYDLKNGSKFKKFIITIALFFSSVFLFALERGNLVILSSIWVTFYLTCYRSTNKILSELALIALALAAVFKAYPALLGFLLIYDRKFFPAVRSGIYAIILAFLPFVFIENGFQNLPYILNNLALHSRVYRFIMPYAFGLGRCVAFFLPQKNPGTYFYFTEYVEKILVVVSILVAPFLKKHWKTIALITCAILMLSVSSGLYNALLLFPVIIMFLNEKEHILPDYLYLILFALLLCPLQFGKTSMYLANIVVVCMWVLLLTEGVLKSFSQIRNRKKQLVS